MLYRQRDIAVAGNNDLVGSIEEQKSRLQVSLEAMSKLEEANTCLEQRCTELLSEIKSLEDEIQSLAESNMQLEQKTVASEDESSQVQ